MTGEQSVHSDDEASNFRRLLEKSSPNSTFSFRSEIISDADSHKGHKIKTTKALHSPSHRRHRSHRSHRSHRDRDRDVGAEGGAVLDSRNLSRLLVYDELEAAEMRRVLLKTSERLEQETLRANDADKRARDAESRALALQVAKQNAQAQAMREQEALKAYQAQVDAARNEIHRAQRELDGLAADKERAEEEAARERSKARAMAKEMEIQFALEQGRQEGKTQGFIDGRKEGWYIGTRDGRNQAMKMMYYDDGGSVVSHSTDTPPLTSFDRGAVTTSNTSTRNRPTAPPVPAPPPIDLPTPIVEPQNLYKVTSTRTATPSTMHKRSGSLAQSVKSRLRGMSEPKPPSVSRAAVQHVAPVASPGPSRTLTTPERFVSPRPVRSSLSPSRDQGRISPIPFHPPPSPRHTPTTPLPSGYIPLQENGRVSLPPPHELDPAPPSPHSPAAPLPPEMPYTSSESLFPPNHTPVAPVITVQEPTPPEPLVTMPEPHPAPPPTGVVAERNIKPSRIAARDYARPNGRPESPPLPELPHERSNKGKQRQRGGPPRSGTGLHAPGRSSPSDTSTEFSQFEIVEQPERSRFMGRGNGSQLSVIMEGGSTAAESPEPTPIGVGHHHVHGTPRMEAGASMSRSPAEAPPPGRRIVDDPREYGEFDEGQLSPPQLAQRRAIAEQLRYGQEEEEAELRTGPRSVRDDVSIKSSTTRTSAPRRRPNPKMPERLGASKAVEVLEKQAEMYDAFGTGRFPSFDSQSSPDEVPVSTRTPDPDFRKRHRKAMSSTTSVPEITIQPPSRPSSKDSKASARSNLLTPEQGPSMPLPSTPSRRHSMQGPPLTPSRVPLPHTSGQIPISLDELPPGFMPIHGPPEVLEALSSGLPSRTPRTNADALPSRSPRLSGGGPPPQGGSFSFPARTPGGIPLPLSSATTTLGLPDNASSAPRGTGRSVVQDLPNVVATSYESAPLPPGFKWPSGATASHVPLPDSVAGNSPRPSAQQTPWTGWNNLGAGATPGPSMPPTLSADRPNAIYAGDGGPNKKVSSSSLASSYKKFEPSTYLDPAYIASAESTFRGDPEDDPRARVQTPSRAGSVRSTSNEKKERRSSYAASVETVTDEDEPTRTPKV